MSDPNQKPPTYPKADRPDTHDLTELGLLREQVRTGWAMLDVMDEFFRSQPQSPVPSPGQTTGTPDSPQAEPTTPKQPASPTTDIPEQLKSVSGDQDFEVLANGYCVPRYLIEVLNDFDRIWPGATFHNARPAIVGQILIAQDSKKTTIYPFCMNDDPDIPEKSSPCIRRKSHTGKHKDNDDGVWPQK